MSEQTPTTLLYERLEVATTKLHEAETVMRGKRRKLMESAEQQIDAAIEEEFGESVTVLRLAASAAKEQLTARLESEALEGKNAPYPIGTKMVEQKPKGGYGTDRHEIAPTGVTGFIEGVTRESKFAQNNRWNRPTVGSYILRLNKNGGMPGLKFLHCNSWEFKHWWVEANPEVAA